MQLSDVAACLPQQIRRVGFIPGAVKIQAFGGPLAKILADGLGHRGVLHDAILLVPAGGNDAVGIFLQNFLIEIGGLAPLAQPGHALGEGELFQSDGGIADVHSGGVILAVEQIGGGRILGIGGEQGRPYQGG